MGPWLGLPVGYRKTVNNDMWLGDVVVSQPTAEGSMGVIAYDLGKPPSEDGEYQIAAINNRLPQFLLDVLLHMQSENEPLEIAKFVSQALDAYTDMMEQFSMPDITTDLLFKTDYSHPPNDQDCQMCEEQYLVERTPRTIEEPRVHYGLVVSGNQHVQDSTTRDLLAEQNAVLCLDQAHTSGLLNQLPFSRFEESVTTVIPTGQSTGRNCAAMTAAAYAKILLSQVRQPDNIEVNRINPSSALSLLKETLLDKALGKSDEAASLVDRLQCLPLAIKQAAGYINEYLFSLE
ncbi:hypothetical protein BDW69DRAFT_187961 [Aspergillus filifer]